MGTKRHKTRFTRKQMELIEVAVRLRSEAAYDQLWCEQKFGRRTGDAATIARKWLQLLNSIQRQLTKFED